MATKVSKQLARLRQAPPDLVILDFDGVVADSELLSNTLLAAFLTGEGLPTTPEQSIERYMGRSMADTEALVAVHLGFRPTDFSERLRAYTSEQMRRDVQAVPGIAAFLSANPSCRFCVASSSNASWLDHGVSKFGLNAHLGDCVFSATAVPNGKPAPDIFLFAADRMGFTPDQCAVIEDSVAGVQGAIAAGMTTLGFLGGAHIRPGHDDDLLAAGAHGLANDYHQVSQLLGLRAP